MMSDWITIAEGVELSGYHTEYLRELARSGKIKAQKWVRDWQIDRAALLAYIKEAERSRDKRRGAKTN